MKLQIKKAGAGGTVLHEVEVADTSISVLDFKQQLSPIVNLAPERIRLV